RFPAAIRPVHRRRNCRASAGTSVWGWMLNWDATASCALPTLAAMDDGCRIMGCSWHLPWRLIEWLVSHGKQDVNHGAIAGYHRNTESFFQGSTKAFQTHRTL